MNPTARPREMESKPFLDHLEDLRRMVLQVVAALTLGMGASFPLAPRVVAWLKAPYETAQRAVGAQTAGFLPTLKVLGGFNLAMSVTLWSGLLLSAPLILLAVAHFVFPGLTGRERRLVRRALGFAGGLFAFGVWMGYRYCLPVALQIMLVFNRWMHIPSQWIIDDYIAFALQLLIAFGLIFELPIVMLFLGRLGIVRSAHLRKYRRHAIVLLLIVAMVLTPPDVFSQLLMGAPLILLYELCVWMIYAWETADRRRGRLPVRRE